MEQGKHILILEDEVPLRTLYQRRLKRKGCQVEGVSTAEEGLKLMEKQSFHIALADIRMPGMSGIDFLKAAKELDPLMEIIMITAYGSIESAVQAMKLGAYDYLTKPCHLPELEIIVDKAFEKNTLQQKNLLLREALLNKTSQDMLLYKSPRMKHLMVDLERVAGTDTPVILQGESGTGKELAAGLIHRLSRRHDEAFIVINCANLQEELVENELFGHEKGAYTGADQRKCGLIEIANQGTLFIDEIGEMSASAQAKVLRVLEQKTFRRVGGHQELRADVRIIAATNRSLQQEVSEKRFRHDLYYRLNVVQLTIPPLRDRPEDIPLLLDYFLEKKNRLLNMNKTIRPNARDSFMSYGWPGNIRELANVVERAIILSDGDYIDTKDLPFSKTSVERVDLRSLADVEREHILKVLDTTRWNKTQSAEILGISVRNLYRKIDQYQTRQTAQRSHRSTLSL